MSEDMQRKVICARLWAFLLIKQLAPSYIDKKLRKLLFNIYLGFKAGAINGEGNFKSYLKSVYSYDSGIVFLLLCEILAAKMEKKFHGIVREMPTEVYLVLLGMPRKKREGILKKFHTRFEHGSGAEIIKLCDELGVHVSTHQYSQYMGEVAKVAAFKPINDIPLEEVQDLLFMNAVRNY